MRVFQNILKLGLLFALAAGVLALTCITGVMNYQGLVSGIELTNLENKPIGVDPLIGWIFEALTPEAGFANWLALVVTALIFTGSLFLAHELFKIVKLLLNRQGYSELGQSEQMRLAVAQAATWMVLLGIPLALIMWGDIYLFQYRALAGAMNIAEPREAAASIPALSALPESWWGIASIVFLTSPGLWMYLGLSLLGPFSLEYLGTKMGTTWAVIETALREQPADAESKGEQALQFYGYDAEGNPVHDSTTPVAYDVNQKPVVSGFAAASADAAAKNSAATPAEQAATGPADEAQSEKLPVIGAQPEEHVTWAEARANEARYYVDRPARRIYARAYWDALQTREQSAADPTSRRKAA